MSQSERECSGLYEFYSVMPDNPFVFSSLFYGALVKLGYSVRFEKEADERKVYVDLAQKSEISELQSKVGEFNISAILDSAGVGGSNEIFYLLTYEPERFYEQYPSVKKRLPISKEDLEACFMRGYEEFQEYLERDPIAKKTGFPDATERLMYERLKAKGVKAITAQSMQNLLLQPLVRIRNGKK